MTFYWIMLGISVIGIISMLILAHWLDNREHRRHEKHAEKRRQMRLDYARKPRVVVPMATYRDCIQRPYTMDDKQ